MGSDGAGSHNRVITSGTWTRLTNLPPGNVSMTFLLTDGTVLAHNPNTRNWYKLTPNSSGSYQNGTWTTVAQTPTGYQPLYYSSAVLADGRVVVIGGEYNGSGTGVWTNLGAIYDPVANAWASISAPSGWSQVGDAQCYVRPDGKFVIAQIQDTRMAVMNPATLTWTALAGTGKVDRHDEEGWTLLPDGTVLTCCAINAPAAQRYSQVTDSWTSAGSTPQSLEDPGSQELGPQVLRPNGTVFCMGATGHNAVYNVAGNSWTAAPDFPNIGGQLDIADGPGILLPNGNVLCATSPGIFGNGIHMFEFDGTTLGQVNNIINNATTTSSFEGVMLMLPTGQVLWTAQSGDVELYTPAGSPLASWAPTITSVPTTLVRSSNYVASGTQFNGLSQCSGYGDDASNATNYPLIRITNNSTGHVFYCRTFNHSTMAVATGSATVSTNFTVPSGAEFGASTLQVVTNGIPSTGVAVTIQQPQITGTVTLQNWLATRAGQPVTIEVRTAGTTTVLDTINTTLDASGNFSVNTSRTGTYDVAIKGSHWLKGLQTGVTFSSTGASGVNLSLVNGDCDNDNTVGPSDLNILRSSFGGSATNADLDGDGVVGPSDLNILRNTFGQSGA